jgi:hypothetical protein
MTNKNKISKWWPIWSFILTIIFSGLGGYYLHLTSANFQCDVYTGCSGLDTTAYNTSIGLLSCAGVTFLVFLITLIRYRIQRGRLDTSSV